MLLDEVGTGTDPAEGAALGAAVLRALAADGGRSAAFTLATTHHRHRHARLAGFGVQMSYLNWVSGGRACSYHFSVCHLASVTRFFLCTVSPVVHNVAHHYSKYNAFTCTCHSRRPSDFIWRVILLCILTDLMQTVSPAAAH